MAASHLTESGLAGIRWVPYGLHACHFYDGGEDLAQSLVPFFLAGLYLGEKCLWITAPPLPATEARDVLTASWSGCAEALAVGALGIVEFEAWYGRGALGDATRIVDDLLREEERALREGYRGLRFSANAAGLLPAEHAAFHEWERLANRRVADHKILALCSYDLRTSTNGRRGEIESAHHCTLQRDDDGWQIRWPESRAAAGPRFSPRLHPESRAAEGDEG